MTFPLLFFVVLNLSGCVLLGPDDWEEWDRLYAGNLRDTAADDSTADSTPDTADDTGTVPPTDYDAANGARMIFIPAGSFVMG